MALLSLLAAFLSLSLASSASVDSTSRSLENADSTRIARRAAVWDNWKPGVKWQIVLQNPIVLKPGETPIPEDAVVFDIDLGHALLNKDMAKALKDAGKIVICYFNAGAYQSWDPQAFGNEGWPSNVENKHLDGYTTKDSYEAYVDIRDATVVRIMKERIRRAAEEAHCDGVDPDNIDAWATGSSDLTGFGLTKADYTNYLLDLHSYAATLKTDDGRPLLLGQKNAPDITPDLQSKLDFAVLEQCRDDNFCATYQPYISAGKPVFQLEYPPELAKSTTLSQNSFKNYCQKRDGDDNFSLLLKHESALLDGWGQWCEGSRDEGTFTTPTQDGSDGTSTDNEDIGIGRTAGVQSALCLLGVLFGPVVWFVVQGVLL